MTLPPCYVPLDDEDAPFEPTRRGFLIGSAVLFEAYGEVFDPGFHWPVIGTWSLWLLLVELLGIGTVVGGVALAIIRQLNHPRRADRVSRFAGSDFKSAYFVEAVVIIEGLGILGVKAFKQASGLEDPPLWTSFVTAPLAKAGASNSLRKSARKTDVVSGARSGGTPGPSFVVTSGSPPGVFWLGSWPVTPRQE